MKQKPEGVLFKVYENRPPKNVRARPLLNGKDFGVQHRPSKAWNTIVVPMLNNGSSFISIEKRTEWIDTVKGKGRERFVMYTLRLVDNTCSKYRFAN